MVKISVLIPVFRYSTFLPKILNSLLPSKCSKEIIVVVDEPTKETLAIVERFKGQVKFLINKRRIGKANALNKAASLASGKLLLFIDSDLEIPQKDFLERVLNEAENADIFEIKKVVYRDSLLARLTYYEYLGFAIAPWIVSKSLKCAAVNGAAFGIRKELFASIGGFSREITEDLDIAAKAYLKGAHYKFIKSAYVLMHVHADFKRWFIQRKRWASGAAFWTRKYLKIIKGSFRNLHTNLAAFFSIFPAFLLFFQLLLSFFIKNILHIAAFLFLGYLFALVFFTYFAKKLSYSINPIEFFAYYFVYSPLFFSIVLYAFIKAFFFGKSLEISDWKL